MKKVIITLTAVLALAATSASAETWKDSFTTRLMKLMTSDPSYTDVVLTDIDQNGIPEAFLLKKGLNGGIAAGITLSNNVLASVDVPQNVIGSCLEDITVYDVNGKYVFVGKEILRYSSEIAYYELSFDGTTLKCNPVEKSKYSSYPAIAYKDTFSNELHSSGYPNRSKIEAFFNSYEAPVAIALKPTTSKITVNGNEVNISGFNINGSNYFKIRDMALILRGTNAMFSVEWNQALGAIQIETGERYKAIGTELEPIEDGVNIAPIVSTLIINGEEKKIDAYSIDDNTYFKIRDIGAFAEFETNWNAEMGCIEIIA